MPIERKVTLALLTIFFMASALDGQIVRGQASVTLNEGWEHRWGDSPRDANGVPVWTYSDDGDWLATKSITSPRGGGDEHIVWLRTLLPGDSLSSNPGAGMLRIPSIFLMPVTQSFECYLGSVQIYQFGAMQPDQSNKFSQVTGHIIELPQNYAGRRLYFRIFCERPNHAKFSEAPILAGEADLLIEMLHKYADEFALGVITFFIGFFSLIVYFRKWRMRLNYAFTFGIFAVSGGLAFIFGEPIPQFIIYSPQLRYYLGIGGFLLFPLGLFAFIDQMIQRKPSRLLRLLWQAHLVFALLAFALDLGDVVVFEQLRGFLYALLVITIVTATVVALRAANEGDVYAGILSIGVAALSLFGVSEVFDVFAIVFGVGGTYHWGVLIFLLLLGYIIVLRFDETGREIHLKSKQLEKKAAQLTAVNETLSAARASLEADVEERTAALAEKNRSLKTTLDAVNDKQHQIMIRDRMASLGNLVAGVAHEINTPIGAVRSSTDVASRALKQLRKFIDAPPEEGNASKLTKPFTVLKKNYKVIAAASDRVRTISRSLTTFARPGEKTLELRDIHQCLDSALTLTHHETKMKAEIIRNFATDIPPFFISPNEIGQVFINILTNSAQAIEGKGCIVIATRRSGNNVLIEISDNGRGIPEENREKIFDPGFTTKGVGVGTGLGLAISYNIIREHGGDVEVESELGKGTKFRIILPLKTASSNAEQV